MSFVILKYKHALCILTAVSIVSCAQMNDQASSDQTATQALATDITLSDENAPDTPPEMTEANCHSEAVVSSAVLEALCITTEDQFNSTGEANSETETLDEANALLTLNNSPSDDLWEKILTLYKLDLTIENKRIDSQYAWFAKNPQYMKRVAKRANRYMYYVVSELEKNDLPGELALLPIVESAFDPFAYSHGRAAGIWQFIPSTGKMYGLKQDWWLDERRDVRQSTDAAIKYLAALNKQFQGNWLHALAAYNSGAGTVNKAIRKNRKAGKSTDFWSLELPKETRAYVPKLMALAKLLQHREQHQLILPAIANAPHFTAVDTKGQIDLANAADLAGISIDELYLLNPQFNRWSSAPEGPFELLVPVDKAENFTTAIANLPAADRVQWVRYKIKEGDVLGVIAQKHNTSSNAIRIANNIRGNTIRAGNTILIPVASKGSNSYSLSASERLESKQKQLNKKYATQRIFHHVQTGDSFWEIAKRYDVNVRNLAKWNGMAPTDTLSVGKKLAVWLPSKKAAKYNTGNTRKVHYTVRNGDNLSTIAQRFNVSIANIKKWNKHIVDNKYLQPKQKLVLYVQVSHGTNPMTQTL